MTGLGSDLDHAHTFVDEQRDKAVAKVIWTRGGSAPCRCGRLKAPSSPITPARFTPGSRAGVEQQLIAIDWRLRGAQLVKVIAKCIKEYDAAGIPCFGRLELPISHRCWTRIERSVMCLHRSASASPGRNPP